MHICPQGVSSNLTTGLDKQRAWETGIICIYIYIYMLYEYHPVTFWVGDIPLMYPSGWLEIPQLAD